MTKTSAGTANKTRGGLACETLVCQRSAGSARGRGRARSHFVLFVTENSYHPFLLMLEEGEEAPSSPPRPKLPSSTQMHSMRSAAQGLFPPRLSSPLSHQPFETCFALSYLKNRVSFDLLSPHRQTSGKSCPPALPYLHSYLLPLPLLGTDSGRGHQGPTRP